MDPRHVVIAVIGLASYLGGILQGLTTVGDAISMQILWRSFAILFPDVARSTPLGDHDLELVTLILVVRGLVVLPVCVWHCRHDFRLGLIQYVLPGQIIFIILGAIFLHDHATDNRLRLFLGIVFLFFGIVCLLQKIYIKLHMTSHRSTSVNMNVVIASSETNMPSVETTGEDEEEKSDDEFRRSSDSVDSPKDKDIAIEVVCPKDTAWSKVSTQCKAAFAIIGPISGFLEGVCGIGGPPIFVVLFYYELPATVIRGTLPICWYVVLLFRSVVSLWQGDFRLDCWPEYLAAITGGIAGAVFGNVFGAKVSTAVFVSTIFVLLVMASLSMMDISPYLTLAIGATLSLIIKFGVIRRHWL